MGSYGVTYDEIAHAAEQIVLQGEIPTIEKIRFKLGKGSNTTISKYLGEWKKTRLQPSVSFLSAPSHSQPSDPVNLAVAKVWEELHAQNAEKIKQIEDSALEKIDIALQEKETALHEKMRLESDNQSLRDILKEERLRIVALEKRMIDLEQDKAVKASALHQLQSIHDSFLNLQKEQTTLIEAQIAAQREAYEKSLSCLESRYQEELSLIKDYAEKQRHQAIVEIDHLSTKNDKLQAQLIDKEQLLIQLNEKLLEFSTRFDIYAQQLDIHENNILRALNQCYDKFEETLAILKACMDTIMDKMTQEHTDLSETLGYHLQYLEKYLHCFLLQYGEFKAIDS
jgi:hypothetical protein